MSNNDAELFFRKYTFKPTGEVLSNDENRIVNLMSSYAKVESEKIKNKLSPFLKLAEILNNDDITLPFIENTPTGKRMNRLFEQELEKCKMLFKNFINNKDKLNFDKKHWKAIEWL